jgi:glycosyltransferase involved in cell wall biosynthesis
MKSAAAEWALSRAGPLDAVIQIGSDFVVSTTVPTATFDDMTVAQHERYDVEWFLALPRRVRRTWAEQQRACFTNADVCAVMTQWAGNSVEKDYGVPPGKIVVVGGGANHLLAPPPLRDWSVPRFLTVSSNWRVKNVPLVVDVFGAIKREWPTATLDIVGAYPGTVSGGVTVHGPKSPASTVDRKHVAELFSAATCFVMPSTCEAYGIAYAEAACAGLASIGTTVGGAPEVIRDGGVTIDPRDPVALHAAMAAMCDGETARRLGLIAFRNSHDKRWHHVAARVIEALSACTPAGVGNAWAVTVPGGISTTASHATAPT